MLRRRCGLEFDVTGGAGSLARPRLARRSQRRPQGTHIALELAAPRNGVRERELRRELSLAARLRFCCWYDRLLAIEGTVRGRLLGRPPRPLRFEVVRCLARPRDPRRLPLLGRHTLRCRPRSVHRSERPARGHQGGACVWHRSLPRLPLARRTHLSPSITLYRIIPQRPTLHYLL